MDYPTVMLHINSHQASQERVAFAAGIVEKYGVHLVGSVPIGYPDLIVGDAYGGSGQLIQMMQQELEEAATKAAAAFSEQCQQIGVASYDARVISGSAVEATVLNSNYADLVIVAQPAADASQPADDLGFVGNVLLSVTRPVMIAPLSRPSVQGFDRILIAWNASNEAARSVNAALPLLRVAKSVQILVVNADDDRGIHGAEPGADLAQYLARHGISAEVCNLKLASDPAYVVFEQASAFGADLLVMGAYGHSRLREYILGGTTREVLRSIKMPVLMAH